MNSQTDIKKYRQQGAALIEMALTLPLFLALIFGMIDFSLLLFEWGKGVEVARHTLRQAVVNQPLASDAQLSALGGCDDALEFSNSTPDFQVPNCSTGTTFCNDYATHLLREFEPENLNVTYGCSGAGYLERGSGSNVLLIPEVQVNLDVTYTFLFSQIIGLGDGAGLSVSKRFSATRTGEDMDTVP